MCPNRRRQLSTAFGTPSSVLLIPLPLNGLWMVCEPGESTSSAAPASSAESEGDAECAKMCPVEKSKSSGPICLLTAGGGKTSIAILAFGVAVVPSALPLPQPFSTSCSLPAPLAFLLNPHLPHSTPPPEA